MRWLNYLEDDDKLRELCVRYYNFLNEYSQKGLEPPPKEMAQKLSLHPEEYSEFLNLISSGGYESIVGEKFNEDMNKSEGTLKL